ncbi:flagellar hook-length control protein FliK [Aestuariirhabdus sp. LZHN29]|uniref:flagellar hook-length control protein FliK n=1 Tax=Aestuariirhabdus sp. LZHN29 TaxID=3417462 RepID=UPI003CEC2220
MQNGTALISFASSMPVAEPVAGIVAPGMSEESPPTTFSSAQLTDLKESIEDFLSPELLAQLFPEGVGNLPDAEFAERVEQLPPFVQQTLYALLGGNGLPLTEQPLPQAAPDKAVAGVEGREGGITPASSDPAGRVAPVIQSLSATAEFVAEEDAPAWLQVLRPLSGKQEGGDPRLGLESRLPPTVSDAENSTVLNAHAAPAGELSALLQRSSQAGKVAIDAALAPLDSLSAPSEVQTNVVPMANGYAIQTREVQPGGPQQLVTEITQTVGTARWGEAVMDKVMWLSSQNVQSAQIRLDPPDLGPLEVKISINSDQANVVFSSNHAQVRDALEQQLARLREMFDQQGVELVSVDVSDQGLAQQQGQGDDNDPDGVGAVSSISQEAEGEDVAEGDASAAKVVMGSSLVDYYA